MCWGPVREGLDDHRGEGGSELGEGRPGVDQGGEEVRVAVRYCQFSMVNRNSSQHGTSNGSVALQSRVEEFLTWIHAYMYEQTRPYHYATHVSYTILTTQHGSMHSRRRIKHRNDALQEIVGFLLQGWHVYERMVGGTHGDVRVCRFLQSRRPS
jgi:hypothetical protein